MRLVTGDSVYGADSALRRAIERSGRGYVLEVTSAQRLGLRRVDAWAEDLPDEAWQRLSAGEGAKGPRLYGWAFLPFRGAAEGWQKGLLVRRKIAQPDALAFYLTLAPAATTLAALVRVAGTHWTIEACFEATKGEVGLDHYEVRSWTGWHRHVTLALLAHAYLTVVRRAALGGEARRSTSRPTCCPSPCRRCAGSSGGWPGRARPIPTGSSRGHTGGVGISNAPAAATGAAEPAHETPAVGLDLSQHARRDVQRPWIAHLQRRTKRQPSTGQRCGALDRVA